MDKYRTLGQRKWALHVLVASSEEMYHLNILKPSLLVPSLFAFSLLSNPCNTYAASLAYITNQASNNVSVIDIEKQQVVKTIGVGKAPVGVAVSSKLQRVYISNVEGQSISVIDARSNELIDTLPIQGSPVAMALSPDSKTLYVADWYDDRVLAIATDKPGSQKTVSVGKAPAGMVVSPDGSKLYVANRDSDDVAVIDTQTLDIISRIPVGKHPYGITLNNDGSELYVVNVQSNSLSVINTATQTSTSVKVGMHPYCVAVHNKLVYITNTQGDNVSVIDLKQMQSIDTIAVGEVPEGISIDPISQKLLVANWGNDTVSVINPGTNKVESSITTGKQSRSFGSFILTTSP